LTDDGARFIRASDRTIALRARRGCAAALAGVASLRHDRHAALGAGANHRDDLIGAARAHDRQRLPVKAAAPIGHIGGHLGGSGEDLLAPYGRVEPRPQVCANVHHDLR
jgi:hypothetical protein